MDPCMNLLFYHFVRLFHPKARWGSLQSAGLFSVCCFWWWNVSIFSYSDAFLFFFLLRFFFNLLCPVKMFGFVSSPLSIKTIEAVLISRLSSISRFWWWRRFSWWQSWFIFCFSNFLLPFLIRSFCSAFFSRPLFSLRSSTRHSWWWNCILLFNAFLLLIFSFYSPFHLFVFFISSHHFIFSFHFIISSFHIFSPFRLFIIPSFSFSSFNVFFSFAAAESELIYLFLQAFPFSFFI